MNDEEGNVWNENENSQFLMAILLLVFLLYIYSISDIFCVVTHECERNENNNKNLDLYSFDKPFLYVNTLFFFPAYIILLRSIRRDTSECN